MAVDLEEIRQMIEQSIPDSKAEVIDEAGGDHLRAIVTAPCFAELSRIDQHRMVRTAVRERFEDGSIHALSIKTEAG